MVATFLLEEAADMNQYDPTDILINGKGKNDRGINCSIFYQYEGYQLILQLVIK